MTDCRCRTPTVKQPNHGISIFLTLNILANRLSTPFSGVEMAPDHPACGQGRFGRIVATAPLGRVRTARMKVASAGGSTGDGDSVLALGRRPAACRPRAAPPTATLACKDAADRATPPRPCPVLDDAAEIHDRHVVREIVDHREVVGDEQIGQPQFVLQLAQQIENLRLHRDIKRARSARRRRSASGWTASARAMAMRCRWPPENSCG